ncbi:adenylate/guanylate cyclase domain-containing protein [Leisingera caerulea]|uniref:adenylate/guanylate cyclase domain-containing protein n=1 Tax=Leisingera caerulea TaxID=506591 RepID=UPI003F4A8E83
MPDKPQRRLAAIFVLDIAGFSRLMAEDDAGTLNQVLAQQQSLIAPAIRSHQGRIVKLMGDGVLAIFPSVISAVEAAAEVQAGAARNRHLQPRIGITLGEVLIAQGDVYGDDVNIAARLEALAPLGGVALSAAAYGQVQGRIPYAFEDMGLHEVKNIPQPVHVYALGQELTSLPSLHRSTPPPKPKAAKPHRGMRPAVLLLAGGLGAAAAAAALWGWQQHNSVAAVAPGSPAAAAFEGRPVIAVLPFTADDLQPSVAAMLAEDVIRSLGPAGGIRLIAPASARAAEGLLPAEAAALLDADFVVTGHLPGALQDGVRLKILQSGAGAEPLSILPPQPQETVAGLAPDLAASVVRYFGKALPELAPGNAADEAVLQLFTARSLMQQGDRSGAERALQRALQMAPDWPEAQALAAMWHLDALTGPLVDLPQRAAEAAQMTAGLPPGAGVLQLRALAAQYAGQAGEALQLAETLAQDYPNDASGQLARAWLLHLAGQGGAAQKVLDHVRRLNPLPQPAVLTVQAAIRLAAGQEAEAAAAAAEALALEPAAQHALALHCASLAALGSFEEAAAACGRLAGAPLTLDQATAGFPYAAQAPLRRLRTGLSLAGLSGRP